MIRDTCCFEYFLKLLIYTQNSCENEKFAACVRPLLESNLPNCFLLVNFIFYLCKQFFALFYVPYLHGHGFELNYRRTVILQGDKKHGAHAIASFILLRYFIEGM